MSDLKSRLQTTLSDSYTIDRELGGGGMSRVFVAEERALGRQVVLKVLPSDLAADVSAERFAREVRLAANLQHPCIVPVLSSGTTGEVPYYTMPLIEGDSLRARMQRDGRLPLSESVKILRDIASAMAYAHERGIVHRDIKPENVLLSRGYAVVADFGIAKALEGARTQDGTAARSTLTQLGAGIGTPAYMAPEQAAGDASTNHRADIYAWGMLAYELLSGRHPFADKTTAHALLAAQMAAVPASLAKTQADIPPALAALVMRAVSKDPADRPQSATELVAALDAVGTGEYVGAAQKRGIPRIAEIAAAVVVIVGAAVAVPTLLRGRTTAGDASVAVMPFTVIGGDTSDVFFGDGMAEELTSALAKVDGLRVASRTAAASLRGKDPQAVRAALGVSNVLEGTVRRANGTLRIGAQLTNAADGTVLWTESFDRPSANVFAIQDEIARAIVDTLRARLGANVAKQAITVSGTKDVQAHEDYLRGVFLFTQRGRDNMLRAREHLTAATQRDQGYAEAFGALAMVYSAMPDWTNLSRDSATMLGRAAAERALRLNPNLSVGHTALGSILNEQRKADSAIRELQLAVRLDSNSAVALHWLGLEYAARGDLKTATELLGKANRSDPVAPHIHFTYASMLQTLGRTGEAKRELEKLLAVTPNYPSGMFMLAGVALDQKDTLLARRVLDSAMAAMPPLENGGVGLFLRAWAIDSRSRLGDLEYGRELLPKLRAFESRDNSGWAAFAEAFAWVSLNQPDSAFASIRRSVTQSPGRARFFGFSKSMSKIWKDPRYAEAIGLAGVTWKAPF